MVLVRLKFPWGLVVVLGLYGLAVLGYVWATFWSSPEYNAALQYEQALTLLGPADGRKCSEKDRVRAFEKLLEVARLMPEEIQVAEHLERLRHRFDERAFRLNRELVMKAELVSAQASRVEQDRKPWLVVGLRDRHWGPEEVLKKPQQVVLWSLPGGALIIALWAYSQLRK